MIKFSISLMIICLLLEIMEGREHPSKSKQKDKWKRKTNENGKLIESGKDKAEVKLESKSGSNGSKANTILPRKSAQRIINGTRMDKASFTFLVSIQALNATDGKWTHGCGGSIVTETLVLTACHCVGLIVGDRLIYGNFRRMRIVAGTDSLVQPSSTEQIRKVGRTVAHPKCSNFPETENGWFGNDVSLLVLTTPFVFGEHVQPMKLYSHDKNRAIARLRQMVDLGQTCVVPGWGSTVEFKVEHPEFLMASTVKLIPDESCRAIYCQRTRRHCGSDFNLIGQVCGVSKDSSDCQGDSGGPLVCNGEVFGTVSYGERCVPGWPSVFQGIRPILELFKSYSMNQLGQQPQAVGGLLNNIDAHS